MSRASVSATTLLVVLLFAACLPACRAGSEVTFAPVERADWSVSTPEAEGIDRALVEFLYAKASRQPTTKSVLVVKNGSLVAEAYFNGGSIDDASLIQSVTKSVVSALAGIAIEQGHLPGVDEKMLTYFPSLADSIRDIRKNDITVQHLLQMRAGYLWEEADGELFRALYSGLRPRHLVDFPLVRDPGSGMQYSNLSAHLVGIVVAEATGINLRSYATENLFGPMGVEIGDWTLLWEGYYSGLGDLSLTARAMARFGQLYLDRGSFQGQQIVPEEWINDSLTPYSSDAWPHRIGRNFKDISYGYLWWSARAGTRTFWFAWGHGGQTIALLPEEQLVVVVKADPLFGDHGGRAWRRERANLNLAADFIASLPHDIQD